MNNYMDNKAMKSSGRIFKMVGIFLLLSISGLSSAFALDPPKMSDYTAIPPFIDQSVKPNILIVLDNSGPMNKYMYKGKTYQHYPDENYYGYFSSEHNYSHDGTIFYIDNVNGEWSGNFLNFMTMRRIDIMRKVALGGHKNVIDASGKLDQVSKTGYEYHHHYTYNGQDVSPYNDGSDYRYRVNDDGNLYVDELINGEWSEIVDEKGKPISYNIKVQKDDELEKDDFYEDEDGKKRLGGVLQEFGHDAFWGNLYFVEQDKDNTDEGGKVFNSVSSYTQFSSFINELRKEPSDKLSPLAESYYVAMQHFKQEEVPSEYDYASKAALVGSGNDPFDEAHWCAKNFVLMLTAGISTQDDVIPDLPDGTKLKEFAENGDDDVDKVDSYFIDDASGPYTNTEGGTDYLKDVAYYARTHDLRPDVGPPDPDDPDGNQKALTHLIPYIVFTDFEEDGDARNLLARNLLLETARLGGFDRQINDNIPGLDSKGNVAAEIKEEDLKPDNFFEASDGDKLEDALRDAIHAMLKQASSGTAASVVTPDGRGEGEGSIIQAHFKPLVRGKNSDREIRWAGYLNSLWIDPCGNVREDSNQNKKLDYDTDKIIEYKYYQDRGTLVQRFDPETEDGELVCPGYDPDDSSGDSIEMDELQPIFEAGKMLWNRDERYDAEPRRIYTYDDRIPDGFDKKIPFEKDSEDKVSDYLKEFLGINEASVDASYELDHFYRGEGNENTLLVDYIRGEDDDALRNRTIDIEEDGDAHEWKLGNIVNSTPIVISGAVEQYDLIYQDESYEDYRERVRDRETMVYVGANDGMLHAFTHGDYDRQEKQYSEVDGDPLGEEIWAYIPQVLLPHLKWLADPAYTHVYYADLQPKVFDAKIGGDDGDEWGTFLLLGLNLGGKSIYVDDGTDDGRELHPSYTLIDITNPREPEVIWERSYEGSGLTTSIPTVFKVGDKWFAAFGSGPNDADGKTDYDGMSDQAGKIFIVDLVNPDAEDPDDGYGSPYKGSNTGTDWFVELSQVNASLNSPTAFDKNGNYSVDGIYFGESYLDGDIWKGNIHKIVVPWTDEDGPLEYDDTVSNWDHTVMFNSPGPVTAALNMRTDPDDNVMTFFGTGRYKSSEDKKDTQQQYMFGIKDPFYDKRDDDHYHKFGPYKTVTMDDNLFYANPIDVTDEGYVFDEAGLFSAPEMAEDGIWDEFVSYVRENYDGWYRELDTYSNYFASQRIISKPSVIGGTLLVPTFTPLDDPCEPRGESNILALYYQTGTGFKRHVLSEDESTGSREHPDKDYPEDEEAPKITAIKFKESIVGAPAASIAHHAGGDLNQFAILQSDTAKQTIFEYDPDIQRSGITGWRDR